MRTRRVPSHQQIRLIKYQSQLKRKLKKASCEIVTSFLGRPEDKKTDTSHMIGELVDFKQLYDATNIII